jgi:hypothetical protein
MQTLEVEDTKPVKETRKESAEMQEESEDSDVMETI